MANISRSKQLLVRMALVTGSTVATIIGAQTLATVNPVSATTQQTSQTITTNAQANGNGSGIVLLRSGDDNYSVQGYATNNQTYSQSSPSVVQSYSTFNSRSSR